MLIRPCKLDSRIKSVDDIQTCIQYDDKFINEEPALYEEIIKHLTELQSIKEYKNYNDIDFIPKHESIPVTIEVTKVYKFIPEFDLEE